MFDLRQLSCDVTVLLGERHDHRNHIDGRMIRDVQRIDAARMQLVRKRGQEIVEVDRFVVIVVLVVRAVEDDVVAHSDNSGNRLIGVEIITEIEGENGGSITKLGLRIPSGCSDFNEFVQRINEEESTFYNQL